MIKDTPGKVFSYLKYFCIYTNRQNVLLITICFDFSFKFGFIDKIPKLGW